MVVPRSTVVAPRQRREPRRAARVRRPRRASRAAASRATTTTSRRTTATSCSSSVRSSSRAASCARGCAPRGCGCRRAGAAGSRPPDRHRRVAYAPGRAAPLRLRRHGRAARVPPRHGVVVGDVGSRARAARGPVPGLRDRPARPRPRRRCRRIRRSTREIAALDDIDEVLASARRRRPCSSDTRSAGTSPSPTRRPARAQPAAVVVLNTGPGYPRPGQARAVERALPPQRAPFRRARCRRRS